MELGLQAVSRVLQRVEGVLSSGGERGLGLITPSNNNTSQYSKTAFPFCSRMTEAAYIMQITAHNTATILAPFGWCGRLLSCSLG